jgi:IS5 family transposase
LSFSQFINIENILEDALNNINHQLETLNLKVKPSMGAIVDATIITSAAAPKKILKAIPVDREEEKDIATYKIADVQLSADKDARWITKGNRHYFGYKSFVVVGAEEGYIEKVSVTPANVSESKHFENAIEGIDTARYYADKGSASAENRGASCKVMERGSEMSQT